MAIYEDPRFSNKEYLKYPFSSHIEDYKFVGEEYYSGCYAHYHKMIEIIYVVTGELNVYLGNDCYNINSGEFIVINSNEIHSAFFPVAAKYITVQLEPELLYNFMLNVCDKKYAIPFMYHGFQNMKLYKREYFTNIDVDFIMHNILKMYKKMDFGFELSVISNIYQLFFGIVTYLKTKGKISENQDFNELETVRIFNSVLDYVKSNYTKNITAKDAAKVVNFSYSYFSRTFNEVMKMSFVEYVNTVRLAESEIQLVSTTKSITEISHDCGFCTDSYFIKKFKQKYGITPLAYRKRFVIN